MPTTHSFVLFLVKSTSQFQERLGKEKSSRKRRRSTREGAKIAYCNTSADSVSSRTTKIITFNLEVRSLKTGQSDHDTLVSVFLSRSAIHLR